MENAMLPLLRFGFLVVLIAALTGCTAPSPQPANTPAAAPTSDAPAPQQNVGDPVVLDQTRTSAEVRIGETFEIRLAANPTTGYSWSLEGRETLQGIEPVENAYIPDQPARVGSGGVERWLFRVTAAGRTTLRFRYARPWEKDVPPAQSTDFTIDAR